jgi:hypothetical protein
LVPKRPNDSSDSTELAEVQAIYCLEQVQSEIRPVGHGLILTPGLINRPDVSERFGPNHTVPDGTDPFSIGPRLSFGPFGTSLLPNPVSPGSVKDLNKSDKLLRLLRLAAGRILHGSESKARLPQFLAR